MRYLLSLCWEQQTSVTKTHIVELGTFPVVTIIKKKNFFLFVVLGMEPRMLDMLGNCSTTEIHP